MFASMFFNRVLYSIKTNIEPSSVPNFNFFTKYQNSKLKFKIKLVIKCAKTRFKIVIYKIASPALKHSDIKILLHYYFGKIPTVNNFILYFIQRSWAKITVMFLNTALVIQTLLTLSSANLSTRS